MSSAASWASAGSHFCFAAVVNRKAMILSYFQHPLIAFLNLAPVLLLGLMLYFLLGRAGLSYGITAVIVLGLTIASWFKLQFRNDPLMFEDLLLLKEAGNMAGKYQLFLTKTMAAALLLVVLGWAALHFSVPGGGPRQVANIWSFTWPWCLCFPSLRSCRRRYLQSTRRKIALSSTAGRPHRSIPPRASSTPFFTV
ncbi:MAG: hypothetical protein ACLSAF_04885 [Intestinimonas sp.]